jgi:hypothetical protein
MPCCIVIMLVSSHYISATYWALSMSWDIGWHRDILLSRHAIHIISSFPMPEGTFSFRLNIVATCSLPRLFIHRLSCREDITEYWHNIRDVLFSFSATCFPLHSHYIITSHQILRHIIEYSLFPFSKRTCSFFNTIFFMPLRLMIRWHYFVPDYFSFFIIAHYRYATAFLYFSPIHRCHYRPPARELHTVALRNITPSYTIIRVISIQQLFSPALVEFFVKFQRRFAITPLPLFFSEYCICYIFFFTPYQYPSFFTAIIAGITFISQTYIFNIITFHITTLLFFLLPEIYFSLVFDMIIIPLIWIINMFASRIIS